MGLNCQAHAAINANIALLETSSIPEMSNNEYDNHFLTYMKMIEQLFNDKFFRPYIQSFLEDMVSWGRSVSGACNNLLPNDYFAEPHTLSGPDCN
jgi:hypothetical protein